MSDKRSMRLMKKVKPYLLFHDDKQKRISVCYYPASRNKYEIPLEVASIADEDLIYFLLSVNTQGWQNTPTKERE